MASAYCASRGARDELANRICFYIHRRLHSTLAYVGLTRCEQPTLGVNPLKRTARPSRLRDAED